MPPSNVEVVVVGAGAAGIAAARRLHDAEVDCLLVEARPRLGGRAWTIVGDNGLVLDLGCGWLHSADRNPWVEVAQQQGATIDKSRPPWTRRSPEIGFLTRSRMSFSRRLARSLRGWNACATGSPISPPRLISIRTALERPDQCARHLHHRRRMGSGFGDRLRPLRQHRRQLARR